MNRWIALLLITLPLPAIAGECDQWTASMEEDEGGPVMMAQICTPAGKDSHALLVTCGTPGQLSMRYLPAGFNPPSENLKADLKFSLGPEIFTRPAVYESMDGAMVAEVDIRSPFTQAIQAQKEMKLSNDGGTIPGATFPLKGSSAALAKLIATCPKP